MSANKTIKDVYFDAIESSKSCNNTSSNCIKETIFAFFIEKTQSINDYETVELGYFDSNWKYLAALTRLYSRIQEEDWNTYDIGSFFVKILNSANWKEYNTDKWRWESCPSLREDVLEKVHEIFGNFGEDINMIEMAYLYTLNDFTTATRNERKISKYGLRAHPSSSGTLIGLKPPSNLENFNVELISCLQ